MFDYLRRLSDMQDRPIFELKAELFKSLAHPARIRALEVLAGGERSVGELQPEVGIELSHLSQQLGVLRRAGLVETRKVGQTVRYSIRDPQLVELLAVARRLLIASLSESVDALAVLVEQERS
ncbi:MAG: metalloregulator ArsR/SmtB family transcription factor [Ilumatobacteraceae bacterium]|jgi:ArsR family transcriptional regulator|nr:metalloregulator ArsR/SmtB family transcription factor [Ilumatobacteraceae bacterium]